jgi:hypothetical protein
MQHHQHHRADLAASTATFPTDHSGLPDAGRPAPLELADGDTLHLRVGPFDRAYILVVTFDDITEGYGGGGRNKVTLSASSKRQTRAQ